MVYYKEQKKFFEDKLTIFKKSASQNWYGRCWIDGKGKELSSRTQNFTKAKSLLMEWYRGLQYKLKNELTDTFMLTYGDGLSNVDLNALLRCHKKNKKKITLTAVHPPARFGELEINGSLIKKFEEKPQLQKGWINGGFFVVEPKFLELIGKKNVMLERSPLIRAVKTKNLAAYKHSGFWFCMDTLRDKKVLDTMIKNKKSPWLK